MDVYDPGQQVFRVDAAFDRDPEQRFDLLDDDPKVALLVQHYL